MSPLALALSLALSADIISEDPNGAREKLVPPYVPRSASFGVFFNSPVVAPNLRLDWNIDLFQSPVHTFFVLVELGAGLGASLPKGMTAQYQYTGAAGVGYRNSAGLINWGFQFGVGVIWQRTAFDNTVPYVFESQVLGYAEGRLQAGYRLSKHLLLGLYFGFGSPWGTDQSGRYPGQLYLGGLMPGVYAEWN